MDKFDKDTVRAVIRRVGELRYLDAVPFEWQVEFVDAYAVMRQMLGEAEEMQSRLESLEKDAALMKSALEDIASGEVVRSYCQGPYDTECVELATAEDMISRAAGALGFMEMKG